MATFEKVIPLVYGTGISDHNVTTTSGSDVTPSDTAKVAFDPAQYTGATVYFEAVFKVSAGTGTVSLYNSGGSQISGSPVTSTSSSVSIVRSAAITLSNDTYEMKFSVTGGNTLTYYSSRIVVVQTAGAIVASETQIPLNAFGYSTSNTAYEDLSTIYWGYFLYTAANWDNATFFLDATLKTSAGTVTVGLHDSSNNLVANATVAATGATYSYGRSASSFSLVDGTEYKIRIKTSAGTAVVGDVRLIVQQANPTKSESHIPANTTTSVSSASGGTFVDFLHYLTYTSTNWSTDTIAWYFENNSFSNTASGTMEAYLLTDASRLTGSNITSQNTGAMKRYRSGALTMPSSQNITARTDSASGTLYSANSHLIALLTWTNSTGVVNNIIIAEI